MEGLILFQNLNSDSYVENENYSFFNDGEPIGYHVTISVDGNPSLEELFSQEKREDVLIGIRKCLLFCQTEEEDETDELAEYLSSFQGHELDLVKDAKYVTFDLQPEEIELFIKKNPSIFEKKIIIYCDSSFDEESLARIEKLYEGHLDSLVFDIKGNKELVGIDDCRKTFSFIKETARKVRSLGLSPLEEIMYVYDLVRDRDRVYVEEDKDEDLSVSRDLTKVLLGDKIVCSGFSNIMNSILKELGFNSSCYTLMLADDKTRGHERVIVQVDDDKYGVHGVYYFDPTWDCRKDDSRNFLYSYKYFAKTKEEIENMKKDKYVDITFFNLGTN